MSPSLGTELNLETHSTEPHYHTPDDH